MTKVPLQRVTNRPLRFIHGPGCCIYCGSTGDPDLHDEHIIPDAISGRIKYPKASCAECAVKTGAVEGRVVNRLFGYARAYMMLKRGHRRKWPEKFPVYYTDEPYDPGVIVEEKPESFRVKHVSPEDHPSSVLMPLLPPAGLLLGRQPNDQNFRHTNIGVGFGPDFDERADRIGVGRVLLGGAGRMSIEDFGIFLAKIAHAYAIAQLGLGAFIPFLTKAIRNERPMYLSHYIGAAIPPPHMQFPKTDDLHQLHIAKVTLADGAQYVLVRVHLFAVDELPPHDVVVGRVTAATPL